MKHYNSHLYNTPPPDRGDWCLHGNRENEYWSGGVRHSVCRILQRKRNTQHSTEAVWRADEHAGRREGTHDGFYGLESAWCEGHSTANGEVLFASTGNVWYKVILTRKTTPTFGTCYVLCNLCSANNLVLRDVWLFFYLDIFSYRIQEMAEARLTLQELENPAGRKLGEKIRVEANLMKWQILWNGYDVVLKVVHW